MLFYPAIGHPTAPMTEGRDEDEWRKRITAKLITGPSVVLIDNLRRPLDSAALSSAITTLYWEDRILGHSEMVTIPVSCAWAATGNNPQLSNEMVRRSIRIRMDARVDRPWLREKFLHPDLRLWASNNRNDLVWAALVIANAWISSGRPEPKTCSKLGQFESWSMVMGGILEHAGIRGFLSNTSEFYETADMEATTLRGFISMWWEEFRDSEVGVSSLWKALEKTDIDINFGNGNERSQKTRLGKLLVKLRNRQFDSLRIVEGSPRGGAKTWRLEQN